MRRETFIAVAMLFTFIVIFGYGVYPDSTAQMAIVDTGVAPDSRHVLAEGTSIWTDKEDYRPEEIVSIFGSGFTSDSTIEINITRPDSEVDTYSAESDASGDFIFYYDLNGITGLYNVTATDGVSWAYTSFRDSLADFKQYANLDEEWVSSQLGTGNSKYYEGMSVPQRILLPDVGPGSVHTLTFSHHATKNGKHAYDWLTGYNQGNDPPLVFDPCGEKWSPPLTPADCLALRSAYSLSITLPDEDTNPDYHARILAYEAFIGADRTIMIYGNQPISSASIILTHSGVETGDSFIHYTLTWTSDSDQILIEMAGHLALSGNPTSNPMAWGQEMGAAYISGGPYHFKLDELDGHATGSQDNQIKSGAIYPADADLWIIKDGPPSALVGEEITYTYTVTNDGPGTAFDVLVTDNLPGLSPITMVGFYDEDLDGEYDDLPADATATGTATYVIPLPGNDPVVNDALVTSSTEDKDTTNNHDDHSVDVLLTAVEVEKSGPDYAQVGETIWYTITVSNPSPDGVELQITSLYDDLLGELWDVSPNYYVSGDTDLDWMVDTGEEWLFMKDYTVATSPDPLNNLVTVYAENEYGCDKVDDYDEHSVDILHPAIVLTKIATDGLGTEIFDAYIGDTITYVFKIENTGDADLTNIILTDITGICDGVLTRGPDEVGDNDDVLEPGEIWIYTCTHLVTLDDLDPLTNIASVEGTYAPGETVDDTDDATVNIWHAAGTLSVDKIGPGTAFHGDVVTYTIYVTYSSPDGSPATNLAVIDDHYGTATYVSGDTDG
ncbi:MAG: hypothetical protein ACFFBJ_02175, partial [Promethearchaeota archaeon]